MLGALVLILLIFVGWYKYPWWTPFVAFLAGLPIAGCQQYIVHQRKVEAGLRMVRSTSDYVMGAIFGLLLCIGVYWFGRGLNYFFASEET